MASGDLPLDLEQKEPGNVFTAEYHELDVSTDRSVWPNNYPFYINDNTFKVEGRAGSGTWEELTEAVDYFISPIFLKFSVSTGSEIASYFVIKRDDLTQIRVTYRALGGGFLDNGLLADVVTKEASGELVRSSMKSWFRIRGSVYKYGGLPVDPNVIDKTKEEVVHGNLLAIANAFRNPNSSTAVLPKDITALNMLISALPTEARVLELIAQGSISKVTADANTAAQVHVLSNAKNAFDGLLHIQTDTGKINMFNLQGRRVTTTGAWEFTMSPNGNRDADLVPTLTMATQGSTFVILCTLPTKATYKFKENATFDGA